MQAEVVTREADEAARLRAELAECREARDAALCRAEEVERRAAGVERQVRERTAELRAVEERLRLATESTGFGAFDYFPQTGELIWSAHAKEHFGLPPGAHVDYEVFLRGLHPADRERVDHIVQGVLRGEGGGEYHTEYRTIGIEDGKERWLDARGRVFFDGQGRAVRFVGGTVDITDAKRAEEELRRAEAHLRGVLDSLGAYVGVMTPDGILIEANRYALEAAHLAREDVVGKPFEEAFWWSWSPEVQARLRGAIARAFQGEPVRYDERIHLGEGRFTTIDFQIVPMLGPDGQVEYLVPSAVDIGDRVQAEEELRASEQRLRKALSIETVGVLFFSLDGHIREANAALERISGYSSEDLRTTPWRALTPPEFQDVTARTAEELATRGKTAPYEKQWIKKDGSRFWGLFAPTRLSGSGPDSECIEFIIDITERKEAEEALRQSEQRFRALVTASSQVLYRMSADWSEMLQLGGGGFIADTAKPDRDWVPKYIHPEDQEGVLSAIREAVRTGGIFDLEHRVLRADGTLGWTHSRAVPVRNADGDIVEWFGAATDITARKQAEEERERLLEAERQARAEAQAANESKDQFVALVAHELRNPLSAITAGVGMLRESHLGDGRVGRALEVVARNAGLQARLVNDLLDLSRLQRGKLQLQRAPVELEKVVAAACQAYETEAREAGLTLTCSCESGLWVNGDFDRLQQVVLNFLSNAVKFTPAGGEVRVRVEGSGFGVQGSGPRPKAEPPRGAVDQEAGEPAGASWAQTEPRTPSPEPCCARIVVEDTGIGMDQAMLDHLFSLFYQGEVAGQQKPGLGIGLSLVKGIVESHGGRVWAESEGPGKGSRFIAELPLVEAPGSRVQGSGGAGLTPEPRTLNPIRVLLVEDNRDTLELLQAQLEARGYEVDAAASGEEALEILGRARPDVILSDIRMPGIDGYEFLRRARELPGMGGVPAFAVTACGGAEDVRRATEAGFAGHLAKPVHVEDLLRMIDGLPPARGVRHTAATRAAPRTPPPAR